MSARLLFVHVLSPLHAGTGQGVGVIDLPVAREMATGLPYLPGSSVKGTLRDAAVESDPIWQAIFGPPTEHASEYAGAAQFSDQRLLLLPVRSLGGTFAWVTSPYVLRRLARDARAAGLDGLPTLPPEPAASSAERYACLVTEGSRLPVSVKGVRAVVLEDLDLEAREDGSVGQWAAWLGERLFPVADPEAEAWRAALRGQLAVVSDEVLAFLLETGTEITARVRLKDDAKTVASGALWYEEALPTETVLSGLVAASPSRRKDHPLSADAVLERLTSLLDRPIQFGGKASVGRGVCQLRLGA